MVHLTESGLQNRKGKWAWLGAGCGKNVGVVKMGALLKRRAFTRLASLNNDEIQNNHFADQSDCRTLAAS